MLNPVTLVSGGVEVTAATPLFVGGGQVATASAVIAINAALSAAVDLGTTRLARIQMPAAWDAAALTFSVSPDGVTYANMFDSFGAEYQIPSASAAAGQDITLTLADFLGVRFIKVRSGTAASPINQTAARSLVLIAVP